MIVTRDYTVIINILYTSDDWMGNRKDRVTKYLERKGWIQSGHWFKNCIYKGVQCSGRIRYIKDFENEKQMEEELADINDTFNDGYLSGNSYSHTRVKHEELEPFKI